MGVKTNGEVATRIVEATVNFIGEFGVQNITTRKIAEYAGVNPALVNYYFGSQEELIDAAISASMRRYFSELMPLPASVEDGSALRNFLLAAMKDAVENPNVVKSYLRPALDTGNCDCRFVEELSRFLEENGEALTRGLPSGSESEKKLALAQMLSSVLFVCVLPGFFETYGKLDFHSAAARESYVARLITAYYER